MYCHLYDYVLHVIYLVQFVKLSSSKSKIKVKKKFIFWYKTSCSPLKINDVSDKHINSIFRVEE
jgi:hypothetical protein